MKKYVFSGVACLFLSLMSCAQDAPKSSPPIDPVDQQDDPPVVPTATEEPERTLPSQLPTISDPMFMTGTTPYESKYDAGKWFLRPLEKPYLGTITKSGNDPAMISFGGGLTAGVSNGGLNREGQQFAYPNLVARQMGVANFKTPLLDEKEANGTGIFLYGEPNGDFPRWLEVTNKLAHLEPGEPVKMTPFPGLIHNFAFPNGGTIGASYPYCPSCKPQAYSSRFSDYKITKDTTLLKSIQRKQQYDFVIMEDFYDAFVNWIVNQPRLDDRFSLANYASVPTYAMDAMVNKGQKGVVFTIPHFKHLGFMNWYDIEVLKKMAPSIAMVYWITGNAAVANHTQEFYLKPTKYTEGVFGTAEKGKPIQGQITDMDIIDQGEAWFADPERVVNPSVRKFAEKYGLALVDLHAVYQKIHDGTYLTEDGLKIDGSLKGNFFSCDGTYPTPLGQAVIANEVIKAINLKYDARISLINVSEFIRIISSK
ncbi:hypothetical protein SAMN04487996_11591 [Dyadobacter soli]|uniref:Uncharacterized protein n=1 Tax=Dyadobacter soli TaxID=659014 RepID=A0A1G7RLQ4_9BACT|nr:hypothetical protein [Dyadobacter soli]SDG11677.1 hypothetical protein SAMN04487996_11591 [Dyadobacter soli]